MEDQAYMIAELFNDLDRPEVLVGLSWIAIAKEQSGERDSDMTELMLLVYEIIRESRDWTTLTGDETDNFALTLATVERFVTL